MRTFIIVLFTSLSTLSAIILAFIVYDRNEQLREYKREVFGVREDYKKLQTDYENYQAKVKNLRQVKIFAASNSTKAVAVGNVINGTVKNVNGEISVYFKDLTTGETVVVDGQKQYYMASLYKVILTLYILEQVKDNKISLSDKVDGTQTTIEEALNKIITESNNEYAVALAETYGWETIEEVMKDKLGIDFHFDDTLETDVENIGKLFEDIALSLKITDFESEYLLKLLNEQQRLTKLPKYLPKNIYSHNKTGELDGYSHDAGIFYTPKSNYILVFMSNTSSPGETNEQMAMMSKKIYEILNDISETTASATTQ